MRAGSGVTAQRIEQAADWAVELQERSGRNDVASQELLGLAYAAAGDLRRAAAAVEAALQSPDPVGAVLRRRLVAQRQSYELKQQPRLPDLSSR